jgi:N-acetylglucosaminyldiphosphoundecaprenol N-acetyl-beta-D-mannosaminyltransferase
MEPQSPKKVSSEQVKQIYQQFRQITLESAARELQQQTRNHRDAQLEALPGDAREPLSPADLSPNQFDSCLKAVTQIKFLGLRFYKMSQPKAVETLLALTQTGKTYRVYFANAHSIEVASRNPAFFAALKRSNLLMADGSGVLLGSRLAGRPLTYNLNGTDLVPALCQGASSETKLSVYFLGAKPGIAKVAAANLASRFPGVHVAGVQDGYFSEAETADVLQTIRQVKPDVLLVAMGTPRQEIWIDQHAHQLPGVVCIAVGGLFDFMAGKVPRAPKLFRDLGVEWIWRLMMEPNRLWKRYTVGNILYLRVLGLSILREKIAKWLSPMRINK